MPILCGELNAGENGIVKQNWMLGLSFAYSFFSSGNHEAQRGQSVTSS